MILVVLVCILAWLRLSGKPFQKVACIAIIAVLITGMTVVTATSISVVEISTGSNQELRVMPPTAFPFTMQQYRDYDTDQFYYRIVLGWPDGVPIYQGVSNYDQSEFIHLAQFYTMILLGTYIVVGLLIVLVGIYLFELRKQGRDVLRSSSFDRQYLTRILIPLIVFLFSLMMFLFPEIFSFSPSHIIFGIGFYGLFLGLGLYILVLFVPTTSRDQNT